PINGVLTIEERDKGEGANKTKTFNITSVPFYPDTNLKPVRVGGKYWAPVNVGATSTTYSANLAGCGYVFQWGRSYVGFTYGSTSDTFGGPVSATDAETTYAGKFITASEAPNDWLNSQNDLLWSGENAQGPCPAGWRVPTEAELTVLNSKYSTANIEGAPGNIRLKIPGDVEGKDLYLPAAGSRTYSPGAWDGQGMAGRYWSSSVDGTNARRFYFGSGSSNMISTNRATGFSVRCIQE
ncbi:MAG: fibrobacter succinogenes major paralogous domain-containing protein, partial [Prevotella sp.]|nr:fibrobacter succinogenes major paralogous domain-containing protein [Prevotella sp.]